MKRLDFHAGQGRSGNGQRGPLLHLQASADDAAAGAAEGMLRAQQFAQHRAHTAIFGLVVGRNEGHRQLRSLAQLPTNGLGALRQGALDAGLFRYGRCPFHQATSHKFRDDLRQYSTPSLPQALTVYFSPLYDCGA